MPSSPRHAIAAVLVFVTAAALAGCAATDYLPVRYRLPKPDASLADKRIALEVFDRRPQDEIFGPAMRRTFRHFTGNFALRVARADERGTLVGPVDLTGLFQRALAERLRASKVQVTTAPAAPPAARMTVSLTGFVLDHDLTRWTARIAYRVELTGPDARRASQKIDVTKEIPRLPGSRDVEQVVGDIFSATINHLDLAELCATAGV